MHEVTIYHNPGCGTSRTTLGLIRTAGFEPEIVEYLKTPPDRAVLESLIERMHIKPRELLRAKESLYTELGLADEALSDDVLIDYMVANPILINRPIVVTKSGAKLCRPSESVLDILQPG
jgi:arsenate reductase (glutaredoxin)